VPGNLEASITVDAGLQPQCSVDAAALFIWLTQPLPQLLQCPQLYRLRRSLLGVAGQWVALEGLENEFSQEEEETEAMIREGDRVRVVPHEVSPPTRKYASQKGYVTMISPGNYGPQLFVQLDNNPEGIDTAFEEDDLEEISPLED